MEQHYLEAFFCLSIEVVSMLSTSVQKHDYISINSVFHYENSPIQIYRKSHLQKLKNFRQKIDTFFLIFAQT